MGKPELSSSEHFLSPKTLAERLKAQASGQAEIEAASFMAERRYLPRGVPLMKRVAGVPGQRVCRDGVHITVDGIDMGEALARGRAGRALPTWQGCRRIADGEVFLMNWAAPDSMDGRYFGPLAINSIIGRAIPLWTDEEGDGRFEWRAATR